MSMYKNITLFFIFLFLNLTAWSQANVPKTLYFKDGGFLLGNLVEKSTTAYVWQLTDGTRINLPSDQVRYIKEQKDNFQYLKNGKIKQTKGLFASIIAGGLFEGKLNEWSRPDHAASINISVGYHINSKISLGVGTGYDGYDTGIIPLYLDLKGDLLNTAVTPYYKISAGYGFVNTDFDKPNPNLNESGGILIHPSIGVKFYTRSTLAWLIDLGYRFQRYDQSFDWDINPRRWTFQRTTFRIGIEF